MPLSLLIPLSLYALASLITFITYGLDKRAARLSRRRIPERRLHQLELAGGWPGAWLAQRLFRHKTYDPRFRLIFRAIIALHVAAWIVILILYFYFRASAGHA